MRLAIHLVGPLWLAGWISISRHPVVIAGRARTCQQITYYYVIKRDGWSIDDGGGKFARQQYIAHPGQSRDAQYTAIEEHRGFYSL